MARLKIQRFARFLSRDRVVVHIAGRDDMQILWTADISKGGLFIETPVPPPMGTLLQVTLETPDGHLSLKAEVVHRLEPQRALPLDRAPGIGVEFRDLDDERRVDLRRYVSGVARKLRDSGAALPRQPAVPTAVLEDSVATIIREFERGFYYLALDMPPRSSTDELLRRCRELRRLFAKPTEGTPAPLQARMRSVVKVIDKMAQFFSEPVRRLEYDFRHGHELVDERIKEALRDGGRSLQVLRRVWNNVHPDRVERARLLAHSARDAAQRGDLDFAIGYARKAVELDPFNSVVRSAIDAWKKQERKSGVEPARTTCPTVTEIPLSAIREQMALKRAVAAWSVKRESAVA